MVETAAEEGPNESQNSVNNVNSPDSIRISEQERHIRELQERQQEELAEEKAILHYLTHEMDKYLW